METVEAQLSRVLFHKPSRFSPTGNHFMIASTTTGFAVKGEMLKPVIGERYRFYGEWQPSKGGYPDAFAFQQYEVVLDESPNGLATYLANYVDGLGPVRSKAIVDRFGGRTLAVLRESPDDLLEIDGISEEIVGSVRRHFDEESRFDPAAYAKLVEVFSGHKIPRRIITSLVKDFGSSAPDVIQENPYILLAYPRMGWATVDAVATAKLGFDPTGIVRHAYAIGEALERIASQGHTFASRPDIETVAFDLVGGRIENEAWDCAIEKEIIAEVAGGYGIPRLTEAEDLIANKLRELGEAATPLPFEPDVSGLSESQAAAVRLLCESGVAILAGGPGTGKTFCVTRFVSNLVKNGFKRIRIATPTGKAAKRADELLQAALPGAPITCSTVHRLLGPTPNTDNPLGASKEEAKIGRGREPFSFTHNGSNPIEVDLVVVDETSMLDVHMAANMLDAISPGTRVVFVGDPNQLPSVGPGSVLRDMIAAGIPTATLTEVRRNAGLIAHTCHMIKDGRIPTPAEKVDIKGGANWVHLEVDNPGVISETIVELHEKAERKGNFDPRWDMQVVSPQKARLPIACDHLNRLLSDKLNTWKKHHEAKPPVKWDEDGPAIPFVVGDKVVRTKNGLCDALTPAREGERAAWTWDEQDWSVDEIDIVNGDVGEVYDIVESDKWYVVVRFRSPDRLCRLPMADHNLIAAYAMTCHKAQGSGFPYVIVPVHGSFYWNHRTQTGLFNRELVYTMFSRAEKLLVTVGQFHSIVQAIGRKTVDNRKTRLASLIAGTVAEPIHA